jgi:hypothetical protein
MASERVQRGLLGVLVVVLLIVGYRLLPDTAATLSSPSNQNRSTAAAAGRGGSGATAPEVHLDTLDAAHPAPAPTTRNLFRFKPKAPPPPPAVSRPVDIAPPVPIGPPPPAPLPPIPLKFIGIVGLPQEKIAVLRDPAGHVDYGGEGAIIGGRYRVLRIGVESIELAYLDGRGRQTIRLNGS